jgi:hypothetical protein
MGPALMTYDDVSTACRMDAPTSHTNSTNSRV